MVRSGPRPRFRGQPLLRQDTSAFFVIVWSVKLRGRTRARGVPSLLDKIARDATMYFLVIFTSHLLLILFEFFAPVSDLLTNRYFPTHEGWYVETNPTHPREVSQRPERCDRGEFNRVLSYL